MLSAFDTTPMHTGNKFAATSKTCDVNARQGNQEPIEHMKFIFKNSTNTKPQILWKNGKNSIQSTQSD